MTRLAAIPILLVLLLPAPARADFARPPDGDYDHYDHYERREPSYSEGDYEPRSTVRLFTGPALRFSDDATRGGLGLALDAGARGAGARFAGTWVRSGTSGGSSQYEAELWLDFAEQGPIHPILAAGAALARLDRDVGGRLESDIIGVGLLRATLQYRLPVHGVDARAALDVVGSMPAVGTRAADVTPWVTAALMVGVGF
jgi:hypothetical protein